MRKETNTPLAQNKDSEYKEIVRQERVFPNLMISKKLEKALPFKSKSKTKELKTANIESEADFLKKHNLPHSRPLKSILTGSEKDVFSMLQRLQTIKNLKDSKAKISKKQFDEEENKKQAESLKKQKAKNRERQKTKSKSKGKK